MKRIKIDCVQPGDILLTARPAKISRAIRLATRGVVSHAMICVQHGSFIDSTADGVQARNLQRELFEDDEEVFLFRLKAPVNRDLLSKITDYARAEIGARYSVSEAMRSVSKTRRPRSRRQFCSRLVARAYKQAGIDLVPDADYCSPEDLRRSVLLREIPVATETVTSEEIAARAARRNPIEAMKQAQNAVLDAARAIDPRVENFNDLEALIVSRPDTDPTIAAALRQSGFLDLWRMETDEFAWRYSFALMEGMATRHEALREYCIGTVKEAYSGGVRFAINLSHMQILHKQHPRVSFNLLLELYETLTINDQARREVACAWLSKHYPHDLKQHLEQIEPHSSHWYSIVDCVEPALAALSRQVVDSEGRLDVCSSCGDQPAVAYRLMNGAETMPGVPSLNLCEDCIQIRSAMGNKLAPFL